MISLGMLPNNMGNLGHEGSGIVHEVGPGVQDLSVGDHVLYLSVGCFSTNINLPKLLCIKLDATLSFEQAAAVPCVYATALMALVDKAHLQRGQVGQYMTTLGSDHS